MQLTAAYIIDRVILTWEEILWGYERLLISEQTVVDYAIHVVGFHPSENNTIAAMELQLAALLRADYHEVGYLLLSLTAEERGDAYVLLNENWEKEAPRKWVFLLFSWLYDHRDKVNNPLDQADQLYDDLNYPEAIKFIGYMPGYAQGSKKEGEALRYNAWLKFVSSEGDRLKS